MTSAEELSASLDGNEAIPFPRIDLDRVSNPVPAILASEEFLAADRYFIASAVNQRALVPSRTHALMHALVRNQRPAQIVEIGTYHGGTTEMLARAVTANGGGTVHTVGPFDQEAFLPVYDRWPAQLRETVRFYPTDSMAFFMEMDRQEPGVLHVQCVLGGFGNELPPEQIMATGSAAIEPGQRAVDIRLSPPAVVQRVRDRLTLETWVIWLGPGSLCLETRATPF